MSKSTLHLVCLAAIFCVSQSERAEAQPPPQQYPPPPGGGYPPPAPAPYPGQPPAPYPQPAPYGQPPPPAVYGYTPAPTGPDEMDYNEGQQIPYGYTKVEKKRKGLIIGGAVTLGVTYIISTMIGAIGQDLRNDETDPNWSPMFLPVVGPYIMSTRVESYQGRFWLTAFGLGQTAGAIMLFYGMTSTRTLLVRNDQLTIAPMHADGATGMAVSGRF